MQYALESFLGIFTDHFIQKCGQFEKKEKPRNLYSILITYKTKGINMPVVLSTENDVKQKVIK